MVFLTACGEDCCSPSTRTSSGLFDDFGLLPFLANSSGTRNELWVSNGTVDGTQLFSNIVIGNGVDQTNNTAFSPNTLFVFFDNQIYFAADDGVNGNELWVSDGTTNGTQLVKNINPGLAASNPTNFKVHDGEIYFSATTQNGGRVLWRSDGSFNGTVLVKDINPGTTSSAPSNFISYNGRLFFRADDGISGYEPWVTDGTPNGTTMLNDINPLGNSGVHNFTVFKNLLYFVANDGSTGYEVWVTDGSPGNTSLFKDTNPGTTNGYVGRFNIIGEQLFFNTYDGTRTKLWRSDGLYSGTQIFVGDEPTQMISATRNMTAYKNKLFFLVGNLLTRLWVSDGTASGTYLLKEIGLANNTDLMVFNGLLYFIASTDVDGLELWVSDGTDTGTIMLKDINPGRNQFTGSEPANFAVFNEKVYFSADNGINGRELWVTDGTPDGTELLKDINPGSGDGYPIPSNAIVFQ